MFALSAKFPSISRMVESLSAISNNLNGVSKEKIFVASVFDEINPFVAVSACRGVRNELMTSHHFDLSFFDTPSSSHTFINKGISKHSLFIKVGFNKTEKSRPKLFLG